MNHVTTRGFSLVELMVALVLGATVTLGIVTMFSSTQESGAVVQGQSRVQDNARLAIDFVGRTLRMAGYVGCVSRGDALGSALNGEFDDLPFTGDIAILAQGFEGGEAAAAAWSPELVEMPDLRAGEANADVVQPGTDVLVVRQGASELRLATPQGASAQPLVVRPPAVAADFAAGAIAVVSDCTRGTVFQISGSAPAGGNLSITHTVGGATVPGNRVASLPGGNDVASVYGVEASVYRVRTTVFYIAASAQENNRGATTLSLWQKIDGNAAVELVDGVTDMEVRFGIDEDGDGVPNRYVNANTVADPNEIVTVRVRFTTNSVDVIPGTEDTVSRDFETTVAVRNRLS